jgi:hypothetical protein
MVARTERILVKFETEVESTKSFMNELLLVGVGENGVVEDDPRFKCNICGEGADFVVQLELVRGSRKYNALHAQEMPFYLCKSHEYVYKKMQKSIELKDYFAETIKENQ